MKKLCMLSILLTGIIVTSFAQINPRDEAAIHSIVRTMEQGWNAKSGKIFSTHFAPTHDYIIWNGVFLNELTREGNAMSHQGIFDSFYKTTDLRVVVNKIRPIREDLALVQVLGATHEHNTPVPENPKVIITMLMEKKNNEWSIISFHNSDIEISFDPAEPNGSQVPPQDMYKHWYAAQGK